MHELGLMASVIECVEDSARAAGASDVVAIKLVIGEMTEAVPEALEFAFEALSEGTIAQGAKLTMECVGCRSRCLECGEEFDHDRFHLACPKCTSFSTELLAGRDLYIDSIEVDIPERNEREDASSVGSGEDTPGDAQGGEASCEVKGEDAV